MRWAVCSATRGWVMENLIALPLAAILAAAASWWLFDASRRPPFEMIDSYVAPTRLKPGEFLTIYRVVKPTRRDCYTELDASLVDSLHFVHRLASFNVGHPLDDDRATISREYQIPFTMPWGRSLYRATWVHYCWPFGKMWPISIELPDLKFEVVP